MTANHDMSLENGGIEVVVAGLTHDLRAGLGVIKVLARLASRDVQRGNTTGALKTLRHVEDVVAKGVDLCSDTLECSRRRATPAPLALEPVDLRDLVSECVAVHRGLAQRPESLQLDLAGPVVVRSHRRTVERIFTNILRNAIAYGGDQPVDVHVRAVPTGAVTIVRDRGPGIPKAAFDRIVRPWKRREGEDASFQHFGLGLWIAKSLVESLDGALHVASEEGAGTAMGFFLPSYPASVAGALW
jgi:two-component system sensor histidine kinase KdpD